jgi:hypothetical protein
MVAAANMHTGIVQRGRGVYLGRAECCLVERSAMHYLQGQLRAKRQYMRAGPCTTTIDVRIVLTTRLPLILPVPIQLRRLDDKTSGD